MAACCPLVLCRLMFWKRARRFSSPPTKMIMVIATIATSTAPSSVPGKAWRREKRKSGGKVDQSFDADPRMFERTSTRRSAIPCAVQFRENPFGSPSFPRARQSLRNCPNARVNERRFISLLLFCLVRFIRTSIHIHSCTVYFRNVHPLSRIKSLLRDGFVGENVWRACSSLATQNESTFEEGVGVGARSHREIRDHGRVSISSRERERERSFRFVTLSQIRVERGLPT